MIERALAIGHPGVPGRIAVKGDDVAVVDEALFIAGRGPRRQAVDEGVVVGMKGLAERVPPRLLDKIVEHAPAGIAKPGRHRVADHLPDTGAVHERQSEGIGAVDVAGEAIPHRQPDLRIGRLDRDLPPGSVDAPQLAGAGMKRAVAVAKADLPIALRGVAAGDQQIGLAVGEPGRQRRGRVVGPLHLAGLAAGGLADHPVARQLAKPLPFDNPIHRQLRAGRHPPDDKWR